MSNGHNFSDKVSDQLRALILRGTLPPNEHLTQISVADRFKLSKIPVREALKELATEGLLVYDRNRGYFVAPHDLDEAMQLYQMRRWIEAELLGTVSWPSAEELADFRDRYDQLDALNEAGRHAEWLGVLRQLRYEILGLSPKKVLLREAMRLWTLTERYRAIFPRETRGSPERNLLDPMEKHDREALLAAYHKDRDTVEAMLVEAFDGR